MQSKTRLTLARLGGLAVLLASVGAAQTIDHSAGFLTHADLQANGNTTFSGTDARLTHSAIGESSSLFSTKQVCTERFQSTFTYQYFAGPPYPGGPFGADGITFTLQSNGPAALGLGGGGLGYQTITNSAAVKFDTYD